MSAKTDTLYYIYRETFPPTIDEFGNDDAIVEDFISRDDAYHYFHYLLRTFEQSGIKAQLAVNGHDLWVMDANDQLTARFWVERAPLSA